MSTSPAQRVTVMILNGNRYHVPGATGFAVHRSAGTGDLGATVFGRADSQGRPEVLGEWSAVEGVYLNAAVTPEVTPAPSGSL